MTEEEKRLRRRTSRLLTSPDEISLSGNHLTRPPISLVKSSIRVARLHRWRRLREERLLKNMKDESQVAFVWAKSNAPKSWRGWGDTPGRCTGGGGCGGAAASDTQTLTETKKAAKQQRDKPESQSQLASQGCVRVCDHVCVVV